MKKLLENTGLRRWFYGLLVWLIPFAISVPFFGPEGLVLDITFFKTLMLLAGSLSVALLLFSHFKRVQSGFVREGLLVGVIWLGVSIGLDLVVLVPMSGQSLSEYFMHIGLRYLVIPITSIMAGYMLAHRVRG